MTNGRRPPRAFLRWLVARSVSAGGRRPTLVASSTLATASNLGGTP
jgi:hypothetical protein